MKRFLLLFCTVVLVCSLIIAPAFGAELNSARFNFSCGTAGMQYSSFEPGDYDFAVYLDGMEAPVLNDVVTITSDEEVAFSFPVDGGYTVWVLFILSSSEEDVFEMEYQLNGSPVTDASGYVLITPCVAPSVPESGTGGSPLSGIFDVFGGVGSWIVGQLGTTTSLFWNGQGLTFLGVLSVCALALAVVLLLVFVIVRFLRFRG